MSAAVASSWHEANQRYLTAALTAVRETLAEHLAAPRDASAAAPPSRAARQALREIARTMPAPSALEVLCAAFGLSPFEREVLLLCAGVELDSTFAQLCATAQGDPRRLNVFV